MVGGYMKCRAFSLIELIVVVAIIALLAAIGVPFYKDYAARATLVKTMSVLPLLSAAFETYYNKNGSTPATIAAMGSNISTISTDEIQQISLDPTFTTSICGVNGSVFRIHLKNNVGSMLGAALGSDANGNSARYYYGAFVYGNTIKYKCFFYSINDSHIYVNARYVPKGCIAITTAWTDVC